MKTKWITITKYVDLDTGELLEEETVKQNYRKVKIIHNEKKWHKAIIWEGEGRHRTGTTTTFRHSINYWGVRKREGCQGTIW